MNDETSEATVSDILDAHVVAGRGGFELDVTLGIAPGEIVLLTGDNGAGKSTLVRALAGWLPLEDGHVTLAGSIVDRPDTGTFIPPERRGIGLVHQDARPFPHMDAVDNVAFGRRARGEDRATARRIARELLEAHGLGPLADRRGADVSGGEGRRIVMARALATRPALLLLDEPLAAIDTVARRALLDVLRSVAGEHAAAVLLVTHDPDEVAALADRTIRLERGRLSGAGPGQVS